MTQLQLSPSLQPQETLYSLRDAFQMSEIDYGARYKKLPLILAAFTKCPKPFRIRLGGTDSRPTWGYTEFAIEMFLEYAAAVKTNCSQKWLEDKTKEYAQSTAQGLETIAPDSAQPCDSPEWELVTDPMEPISELESLVLLQTSKIAELEVQALQLADANQGALSRFVQVIQESDRRAAQLKAQKTKIDDELFKAEIIAKVARKKLIQQEVEQALGV